MKKSQLLEMKDIQPMSMHEMKEYTGDILFVLPSLITAGIGFILGAAAVEGLDRLLRKK
jgi:hypothetical protein